MKGFRWAGYENKPTWQWTEEDHRYAFEAHMRRTGLLQQEQDLRSRGALWSPMGPGFGGGAWPFSLDKAKMEIRYAEGIKASLTDPYFDSLWRERAKELFVEVEDHYTKLVNRLLEAKIVTPDQEAMKKYYN